MYALSPKLSRGKNRRRINPRKTGKRKTGCLGIRDSLLVITGGSRGFQPNVTYFTTAIKMIWGCRDKGSGAI
jgi:hypothetical protein